MGTTVGAMSSRRYDRPGAGALPWYLELGFALMFGWGVASFPNGIKLNGFLFCFFGWMRGREFSEWYQIQWIRVAGANTAEGKLVGWAQTEKISIQYQRF